MGEGTEKKPGGREVGGNPSADKNTKAKASSKNGDHKTQGTANKTAKTEDTAKPKDQAKKAAPRKDKDSAKAGGFKKYWDEAAPLKRSLIIAGFFALLVFIGGMIFLIYEYQKTPELNLANFEYVESTQIRDKNGEFYQSLQGVERRESVTIAEIPDQVKQAFIAIEDQRFYQHSGIDIRRLGRAVIDAVTSGTLEGPGGSTITQQLIKLTHLTSERSLERKIQEMVLASKLEKVYTKDQILEAYLNKINLSQAWGVQAAAQVYFNKNINEVSLSQAAIIASIANLPSYYDPYVFTTDENGNDVFQREEDGRLALNPNNVERSLNVIAKMKELGYVDEATYQQAEAELKTNQVGLVYNEAAEYSYFTDSVYSQVVDDLMEKEGYSEEQALNVILNGGLIINATVDPRIQGIMEAAAANEDLYPSQSGTAAEASALVTAETGVETNYIPQIGMTIVDNTTGQVAGIVGGREHKTNLSLNRAMRHFQPGSVTKPLTAYGPGIEKKTVTLGTLYDDTAILYDNWRPNNASMSFSNTPMTVREGLTASTNTIAVQASLTAGLSNCMQFARDLGLDIVPEDETPAALALGGYTNGQTTLAIASAYATFPNGGQYREPSFYSTVTDKDGNVLLEAKQEPKQVFSPQTTYLISDVLKDVVQGGTTYVSIDGHTTAGKTGTTDEERHAWFAGYTSLYSMAVWYGYDENVVETSEGTYYLNINLTGGEKPGPAGMFEVVMDQVHAELPGTDLPGNPGGISAFQIDRISGNLATGLTARDPRGNMTVSELFIDGTQPKTPDTSHVEVTIDTSTGLLARGGCPANLVRNEVRLNNVAATFPPGITPENGGYTRTPGNLLAPTGQCTAHGDTPAPSPTVPRPTPTAARPQTTPQGQP